MGIEIDLLKNYPKQKRDLNKRLEQKTEADRAIARKFDKEFFDGDRRHGYGGYNYKPIFWENVIPDFKEYYKLSSSSSVLDIGCAKGFMLCDFQRVLPGITVAGVDISKYAIENAKEEVKPFLKIADARELPFEDNSFDLVVSIATLHNLVKEDLKIALKELARVSKKNAFVTLDAYRNNEEKRRMEAWNLTALTMMHTDEWREFFRESGYNGDYYWFIP